MVFCSVYMAAGTAAQSELPI